MTFVIPADLKRISEKAPRHPNRHALKLIELEEGMLIRYIKWSRLEDLVVKSSPFYDEQQGWCITVLNPSSKSERAFNLETSGLFIPSNQMNKWDRDVYVRRPNWFRRFLYAFKGVELSAEALARAAP